MAFSSDPFQRVTTGGTFNRTVSIFLERYDLFLLISAIIFIPLAFMSISIMLVVGSSMHTLIDAGNAAQVQQNAAYNEETGSYSNEDAGSSSYNYDATNSTFDGDSFNDSIVSGMSKFGILFFVEYLVFFVFSIAGKAAMAHAVAETYAARDSDWKKSLKQGFSRWCDLFGAVFLVGFGSFVCNMIVQFVIIVIASSQSRVLIVLAMLGLVAWWVVLIYIMVSLMILAPVIMVEGTGPLKSIKRCWELAWNNRCYIFCTAFCLVMVYYAVQLVLTVVLLAFGGIDAVYSTGGAIIVILPAIVFIPMMVITETVVYLNIRVQQEGLNYDVLVRNLDGEASERDQLTKQYAGMEPMV